VRTGGPEIQTMELSEGYPLASVIEAVRRTLADTQVRSTGFSRQDYAATIQGIVDYFCHFQAEDGRIFDPFEHREIQYSTPCYAWAATALLGEEEPPNLLESAARALECALEELVFGGAAEGHGDFFTFPILLAYEGLRERVPTERRARWEQLLREIEPRTAYRYVLSDSATAVQLPSPNWNVVAVAGEFLRYQAGFADQAFVERYLNLHVPLFTAEGLYRDPHVPMAYDHFPRHFLAVVLERGYTGQHREALEKLIDRGAWTSLLMQSPCGEWPTGGRSGQHQWNEAMQCVTYEVWARRKQREGDFVAACAFKRAARLALQAIRRWVRPSGELWIVKNRFDPAVRHGYEYYSFHSQYNLLAASMLATAHLFADDSIPEGPAPADVGGFVLHLPDFHKVIANAGGLYLELDTAADPSFNSTGLLRVHKVGVDPLLGPSDGSSIANRPLAVGVAWQERERWQSLAGIGIGEMVGTQVRVHEVTPQKVYFGVDYVLNRPAVRKIRETYECTPIQARVTVEVEGDVPTLKVRFPMLAFDGQRASQIAIDGPTATVRLGESMQVFAVEDPLGVSLFRTGEWVLSRNGFLEVVEGVCQGRRVVYTITPR
jgi:hypothetical protein